MHKLYKYVVLFLVLVICEPLLGQNADYQVVQTQSANLDTVYLQFNIRRAPGSPAYKLAGYNLVFNIDTSLLVSSSMLLKDEGFFAANTLLYQNAQAVELDPTQFQLYVSKRFPQPLTLDLPDAFVSAGRVAFLVKRCGTSVVTFNTSSPATTIARWNDLAIPPQPVVVNSSQVSTPPLVLSKKGTQYALKVNKDTVCTNGTVQLHAPKGFSNYSLQAKTGATFSTAVSSQNDSVFRNVTVAATTTYRVIYRNGACTDTTFERRVVTSTGDSPLIVTPVNQSVCLGNNITFTATPVRPTNNYVWRITTAGAATPAFIGGSSGLGKDQATIRFSGNGAYSATVSVQDTNKFGCASLASSVQVSVTACSVIPNFTMNGSETEVTICQGESVAFRNTTVASGSTIVKRSWDFGAGSNPDTSNLDNVTVTYSSPGLVNVKLIVTDDKGIARTVTKQAVKVLPKLSTAPSPTCGSSECNEVNFNWQSLPGATAYQVRYWKNKNGTPFTASVGTATTFKVTSSSPNIGSLAFSDTQNDTIYFQVTATAGSCDTKTSGIVFCRPSYCTPPKPGCNLPAVTILPPPTSCKNDFVKITAVTNPNLYYNQLLYARVRMSWNNGKLDTSHTYNTFITSDQDQEITLTVTDTANPSCYRFSKITIPVSRSLSTKPDLGIQSLECDRATFQWKEVVGATKYQIKYSSGCTPTPADWFDAPLGGQAKFYEITGLSDLCKVNFQVRAIGNCDTTQSDTLISPPTCTCYIGHIASSNIRSCALDTAVVSLSGIKIPNFQIRWFDPSKNVEIVTTDTIFKYVPSTPNRIDVIRYTIVDLNNPGCETKGTIIDSIKPRGTTANWSPFQSEFCIKDAFYSFDDQTDEPGHTFYGTGIRKEGDKYFFHPSSAGLGTHTITYNACGITQSHPLTVRDAPCVSTVVGGFINNPNGLYTACDGTIYITTRNAIYRSPAENVNGIPELLFQGKSANDTISNFAAAIFGEPYGLVLDESTNNELYFADHEKHIIRRAVFDKQRIERVTGLPTAIGNIPRETDPVKQLTEGRFNGPSNLAIYPNMDTIYAADDFNNNIKSFTFKGASRRIKLVAGKDPNFGAGLPFPTRGKLAQIYPSQMAVDSFGINIADASNVTLYRYQFASDTIRQLFQSTAPGYADGMPGTYRLRNVTGVTPQIGEWIYFTDKDNSSLRRFNVRTSAMETVAGAPPPTRIAGTNNGPPSAARFNRPEAISFNIKGYIDILETGSIPNARVRRYYLPRWGVGTWNNFDSLYIANCDSDTLTPEYVAGKLRVVRGNPNALVNRTIFMPKDTGQYTLGYTIRVGSCDTTFFKNVYVRSRPRSTMRGDTVCGTNYVFTATAQKDPSLRYKWFGPDSRTIAISVPDTSRSITVTQTGKYWVEIYYGKNRTCFARDSARVRILSAASGQINKLPKVTPYVDSVLVCADSAVTLSMDELSVSQPKFKKFEWSTGATTRTISAVGPAVYEALAVDSLGCKIKAKFKVVNRPLPNICLRAVDRVTGKTTSEWGRYTVSTIAGIPGTAGAADGKGRNATFKLPWGLALYKDTLFVTDNNHTVRAISLKDTVVRTYLGVAGDFNIRTDSAKASARFNTPNGITIDKQGNIYVVNNGNHTVYKWDRQKNKFFKLAGLGTAGLTNGPGATAEFNSPRDLVVDAAGYIYVADYNNHNIRVIDAKGNVQVYAGPSNPVLGATDGKASTARFNWPWGIAIGPSGNKFVAEDANHAIRRINLDTLVRTVAGTIGTAGTAGSTPYSKVPGLTAGFSQPWNLTTDPAGNVYFTDAANRLIRRLDRDGNVTTLAGRLKVDGNTNGSGDTATFNGPTGIAFYPATGELFVADQNNHTIRKLTRNKEVYVCRGSEYYIRDTCNPVGPNVVWSRKPKGGSYGPPLTAFQMSLPFTGEFTYRVEVTQPGCGQKVVDSIVVNFFQRDESFVFTDPVRIDDNPIQQCKEKTMTFTVTPGYSQYIWYKRKGIFYDTVAETRVNRVVMPLDSIETNPFIVGVIVKNNLNGCYDTTDFRRELRYVLRTKPIANFKDTLTCLGNTTEFTASRPGNAALGYTYRWDFGVQNTLADTSIYPITSYAYTLGGTYNVRLIVNDYQFSACADTITKAIRITKQPNVTLLTNGADVDSLKFCGASTIKLNLKASFTPDPGSMGPFTYKWFEVLQGGGGLDSASTKDTTSARPPATSSQLSMLYGYGVYVKDGNGCASEPDTVFARISTPPNFLINIFTPTVCMGSEMILRAVDAGSPPRPDSLFSFRWDSAGVQLNRDTTNPELVRKPYATARYRVTVKDRQTSCSTSVLSDPIPVVGFRLNVQAAPYPDPCSPPDSLTLTASITRGTVQTPYLMIQWRDSTSTTDEMLWPKNSMVTKIRMDTTRVYEFILQDNSGCSDTGYVRVPVASQRPPVFDVVQGADTGVCVNGSVKLKLAVTLGEPPYAFTWRNQSTGQPAPEVNLSDPLNPVITAVAGVSQRTYVIGMRDRFSCRPALEKTVSLKVYNMDLSFGGTASGGMCRTVSDPNPFGSVVVRVNENFGQTPPAPADVFSWKNEGQIIGSDSVLTVNKKGWYAVTVTNTSTACVRRDSIYVGILNDPNTLQPILHADTVTACNNTPVHLYTTFGNPISTSKEDSLSYSWSVINGLNTIPSRDSVATYMPNIADTTLMSFVVRVSNRCGTSADTTAPIRLKSGPRAHLEASETETFTNREITFTNLTLNANEVVLKTGDGVTVNMGFPYSNTKQHIYINEGTYVAKLTATNTNGCKDHDSLFIKVINKMAVWIPNVFSPSANQEENRYFRVYGVNISPQDFNLQVYNRWGQLVYSTTDLTKAMYEGWDGRDAGGEAQIGVYTYVIKCKLNNGQEFLKTNTVTLLR